MLCALWTCSCNCKIPINSYEPSCSKFKGLSDNEYLARTQHTMIQRSMQNFQRVEKIVAYHNLSDVLFLQNVLISQISPRKNIEDLSCQWHKEDFQKEEKLKVTSCCISHLVKLRLLMKIRQLIVSNTSRTGAVVRQASKPWCKQCDSAFLLYHRECWSSRGVEMTSAMGLFYRPA